MISSYLRSLTFLLVLSLISLNAFSQRERVVEVDSIPKLTEDFMALREKLIQTPEGACALFLVALKIFQKDKVVGNECMISVMDRNLLLRSNHKYNYKGYIIPVPTMDKILGQMKRYPYLPDTYFWGARPGNRYRMEGPPHTLSFTVSLYSGNEVSGKVKYFAESSGASRPRAINVLRSSKGEWLISGFEELLQGVKRLPPLKKPVDD